MPHAVIHVDVTALPDETAEAFALEIRHGIHAVPVNTRVRLAVVNVGLAQQPRPASAAGAAEGIEQIVAGAGVEARARGANISPSAAQLDGSCAGLAELFWLGVRDMGSERQVDPPDLHLS